MSKIILSNLVNLQNGNTAVNTINNNNAAITTAMENTLSRDGTAPNQMGSNLDMNGWHINNLPIPSSDTDPIRRIDLINVSQVTNVLHTASSTSNTIGTGNKTFTVPSGLGFFAGQYLLIQDAASTANYMIGRVVSYSSTSLVFNSTVVAGSGTKTSWLIDISGAPGPVSVVYDTVSNAIGATIPGTLSFLALAGYTTAGDGGNGLYHKVGVMPTHAGKFQSADGAWWELVSQDVTPEMFNCKGDAVTDDRANFQNCIDFVNSRGGGNIQLTPSKTYRIILTGANSLANKAGVNIFFRGATMSLEQSDTALGFRMNSNSRIIGPGNLFSPVSTALGGSQGIYHATISFGNVNGGDGTVASPSPLSIINNIVIDGLTITNARNDGNGSMIQGLGGCHDITIQNCIFPDTANPAGAIGFDWGYYGTQGTIAQDRVAYDGGTFFTIHPHNLVIKNNQIGALTNAIAPGSHAIRCSSCYDVLIKGNDIQSTTGTAIFQTGGDLGFEFAPSEVRLNACKNIFIEDNNIHNFTSGYGIRWDCFPDNVQDAVTNPANPSYPYAPIGVTDGYVTNNRIVGNKLQTVSTINSVEGIIVSYTRGLYIGQNYVNGGFFSLRGIRLQNGAQQVIVEGNDVSLFQGAGIYLSDTTLAPTDNIIRGNTVYRNGNSVAGNANIYVNGAIRTIVEKNNIGGGGEDQAFSGIRVDASSVYTSVIGNKVSAVKPGGSAFNLAYGNTLTGIWVFADNFYSGAETFILGTSIVPYRRDFSVATGNIIVTHAHSQRGSLTSDITPTFGAWGIGSTCTNLDSTTGQVFISKCTVSGSPGTWKAVASVS